MTTCDSLIMNIMSEPYAGKPHVRFDEEGGNPTLTLRYVDGLGLYNGYFAPKGVDPRGTSAVDGWLSGISFLAHAYTGNGSTLDLVQLGLMSYYLADRSIQSIVANAKAKVHDKMKLKKPCSPGESKLLNLHSGNSTGNFFVTGNKAFGPENYPVLNKGYVSANYKASWKAGCCQNGSYEVTFDSTIYFFQRDRFADVFGTGNLLEIFGGGVGNQIGEYISDSIFARAGVPFFAYDIVAYWNVQHNSKVIIPC